MYNGSFTLQSLCLCYGRDLDGEGVDVGTKILYKLDQHLVCQSTHKASEMCILKGEFANDVVLMAHSKEAAATALRTYVHGSVAGDFGLTVSVPKTKFLVVGGTVTDTDKLPLL